MKKTVTVGKQKRKREPQKRSLVTRLALWVGGGFAGLIVLSIVLQSLGIIPSADEIAMTETSEAIAVIPTVTDTLPPSAVPSATEIIPSSTFTATELEPTATWTHTEMPTDDVPTENPYAVAQMASSSTATATASRTSTNTPLPTNTAIPTNTPLPTNTAIPTNTSLPTNTLMPTSTPTLPASPVPTVPSQRTTMYITGTVNVRPCPRISDECASRVQLSSGQEVEAIDQVQGDAYNNVTNWWRIVYGGEILYVHSAFISTTRPVVNSAPPPQNQSPPVNQLPPPAQTFNCVGDIYNCGDFSTCQEMFDYWNTCSGDPSKLDSNNDGRPCESRCG